ncbi:MAG TPA: hypothetical protein VK281_15195, partial [Xanthobacteraceae bacterium]|nr:hypothetical protein [Xanthobacteraceae bacterium]
MQPAPMHVRLMKPVRNLLAGDLLVRRVGIGNMLVGNTRVGNRVGRLHPASSGHSDIPQPGSLSVVGAVVSYIRIDLETSESIWPITFPWS